MKHHNGIEPPIVDKPLRSKIMKDVCKDAWDGTSSIVLLLFWLFFVHLFMITLSAATFIDSIGEDRQKLYDLILAANYLDIKVLLHLGCAKVASLIKGTCSRYCVLFFLRYFVLCFCVGQPLEKIKEILSKGIVPAPTGDKSDKNDKNDKKKEENKNRS